MVSAMPVPEREGPEPAAVTPDAERLAFEADVRRIRDEIRGHTRKSMLLQEFEDGAMKEDYAGF